MMTEQCPTDPKALRQVDPSDFSHIRQALNDGQSNGVGQSGEDRHVADSGHQCQAILQIGMQLRKRNCQVHV